MVNLANGLTLSRFVSAPLFLALVLRMETSAPGASLAALAVLVITLLTDMFDGMAARAQQQVTNFGKIMDPVADSTFFLTALFAFSASERFRVPIWIPLIVLYREIAMHVLRRYAALAGIVLAAKVSGKAKMVTQSVALGCVTLGVWLADSGRVDAAFLDWIPWVMGLIAVVNVLSMVEYLREIPRLREKRVDDAADATRAAPPAPDDADRPSPS